MRISHGSTVLTWNKKASFVGVDGVAPYFYEVLAGGVGGTIDQNGWYKAPSNGIGSDIIRVTDSDVNPTVLEIEVKVYDTIGILCDIIEKELDIEGRVWIWNQKVDMPIDDKMFVAISVLSVKPYANNIKYKDGETFQYTNVQANVSIDVISKSLEALIRKEEVILALCSPYSRSQQKVNQFHIASIPQQINDASSEDGAAIPYRYNFNINLIYSFSKKGSYDNLTGFDLDILTDK